MQLTLSIVNYLIFFPASSAIYVSWGSRPCVCFLLWELRCTPDQRLYYFKALKTHGASQIWASQSVLSFLWLASRCAEAIDTEQTELTSAHFKVTSSGRRVAATMQRFVHTGVELSEVPSEVDTLEGLKAELPAVTTLAGATPAPPAIAKHDVVALVFFGFFPRDFGAVRCPDDFTSVKKLSLPNLWQQVVQPSLVDGYNVTVVGHTWSNSKCGERKTHNYTASDMRAAVVSVF